MSRSTPPQSDELEISVIGPGLGECILLHLGDNDWCIVDSCIARDSQEPVALEYLRGFENDALARVRLILATHWHDDHIRGLSSLVRECPSALFSCSGALNNAEFITLAGLGDQFVQRRSGIDEFKSILEILTKRRAIGMPIDLVSPQWALSNRRILHLTGAGRSSVANVTALSPSDGVVGRAFREFAGLLPVAGQPRLRVPNRSPNRTSVALWVEVDRWRLLLGADLEYTAHPGEGWLAVLQSHQDEIRAVAFKVPHHGSLNADCAQVWTAMLVGGPIAVVTPFSAGARLPRASDLTRLSGRTANLYCTAAGTGQPPRRDNAVERFIRRETRERRVIEGQPGHVRLRWSIRNPNTDPLVETFNGAYKV